MFFFFKQKTAYEMRISDWSSDVCSSDLRPDMRGGVERIADREARHRLRHRTDDLVVARIWHEKPRSVVTGLPVIEHDYHRNGRPKGTEADVDEEKRRDRKSDGEGKGASIRCALGGRSIVVKTTMK